MIRDIATVLVVLAVIPAWLFVIQYHVRTHGRWHDSALGRHLMSFVADLAALLSLALAARIWGPHLWISIAALVLYAGLDYVIWRRYVLMLQATRDRGPRR